MKARSPKKITCPSCDSENVNAKVSHPTMPYRCRACRRIACAALQAGLQGNFTGHSGRVGLAVRRAQNAAPTDATMRQGRWASAGMLTRYIRQVSAGEALHWL